MRNNRHRYSFAPIGRSRLAPLFRLAAWGLVAWGAFSAGIAQVALTADAPGEVLDEAAERVEEFIEHSGDSYYTLVDRDGRTLTFTSLSLAIGDSYINEENREYEVTAVDGNTLRTEYVGTVELPDVSGLSASAVPLEAEETGIMGWWNRLTAAVQGSAEETEQVEGPIAIYFTHSDESYVPASGVSSKEKGDVYQVGHVLRTALEDEGYGVVLSENNHNPHDGQAYNRSRRTVTELLEDRPSTMIDVHRDAIPVEEYMTTVEGQPASKVRIVVGKQNQNRELNLEYAKRIKAVGDEKFPGLIKGIFHAQGNYNQDVGPRMILLEFGTDDSSLEHVEKSAGYLAQVIPAAAGLSPSSSRGEASQSNASGWRSALWVLLVAAVVTVGYVALNARSGGEVAERLRTFLRGEFPRVANRRDGEDEDGGDQGDDGGANR